MKRSRRNAALMGLLMLGMLPTTTLAELPLPTYPDCGKDNQLDTCPPDIVRGDGSLRGSTWERLSFIPEEAQGSVRTEELVQGSGNGVDVAWRSSTGRFDVTIAVLDSGILWDRTDLLNKVRINQGELPLPMTADGATCSSYDCNGDTIVNIQDYANDPRVRLDAGDDIADDRLDPSDLIATFSNGVDEDQNAFVDDIAGWDFLWNDNNPFASNGFGHGSGVLEEVGAEGGQPSSDIGYCPNCAILPLRTGDSFMTDADRLGQGILYAADNDVQVVAMASGTINNTPGIHDALEYAWQEGVLVIGAIGDEMSYHHLFPGASDYLLAVHSIRYWPLDDWSTARSFLAFNGCNNFGSHLVLVAGTTACATGATGITAGTAGLIFSRGRDLGYELHPDEVRGMLVNSATDIAIPGSGSDSSPWFPSRPGWDVYFGYGRVNGGNALENWNIPPQVHLTSPSWYDVVDASSQTTIPIHARMVAPYEIRFSWRLEWAPGGDVNDDDFQLLASGVMDRLQEGLLYEWPISAIPVDQLDPATELEQIFQDDPVTDKFDMVNIYTITLRLTAVGETGRHAEMRKSFFLHEDPDLLPGFPLDVGASGQSSPIMEDVDDDGVNEILLGTAGGEIHVLNARTGDDLPGWPVTMPLTASADPSLPGNHAEQAAYTSGEVAPLRQQVLPTLVVGDLDNDGLQEIVASTMDGQLYVFDQTGQLRDGFPVSRDPVSDADTSYWVWLDPGFISSPRLADLDGDGYLEIIQAGMDQKLYVWREDGSRQEGFPVLLEYEESINHIKGRVVSSPAITDMNQDGVPDIVVGTNEYDPELYIPGYAYAISGLGELDPRGPILQGWPVSVPGAINGLVPFVGEGAAMSPIVADVDRDGRPEVVLSGTVACPHLYEHDGRRSVQYYCGKTGWDSPATDDWMAITYVSNPTFGDFDQDGDLEVISALSGLSYLAPLAASTWQPYQDHVVGMWDARTGESVPGWPVVIEDLPAFMKPAAADVNGDGFPEVLVSSGGYVVHAFDLNGVDVAGWPKFTGGFLMSAIAAGDVTGDGRNEVALITNEGFLYIWKTNGVQVTLPDGVDQARLAGPVGHQHPHGQVDKDPREGRRDH